MGRRGARSGGGECSERGEVVEEEEEEDEDEEDVGRVGAETACCSLLLPPLFPLFALPFPCFLLPPPPPRLLLTLLLSGLTNAVGRGVDPTATVSATVDSSTLALAKDASSEVEAAVVVVVVVVAAAAASAGVERR